MKGIIALDIDGTLTDHHEHLPSEIVEFLTTLALSGWKIIFITGRTIPRTAPMLGPLDFPYHLAAQNGAIIIEMPSKTVLFQNFLPTKIISFLTAACKGEPSDVIVYADYFEEDCCYYRSSEFDEKILSYVLSRAKAFKERWNDVSSFNEYTKTNFPAFKFIGDKQCIDRISNRLKKEKELIFDLPIIEDPFDKKYFVAQGTAEGVNKGEALAVYSRHFHKAGPIIAAGDDRNDHSMLEKADIKIVMDTANVDTRAFADIICPSASEKGIIEGIKRAIE